MTSNEGTIKPAIVHGKTCTRNPAHGDLRYVSSRRCVACQKEADAARCEKARRPASRAPAMVGVGPVIARSDFIKPITIKQLMAGR